MGIWVPQETYISTVMLTQTAAILQLRTANFFYWVFNDTILKNLCMGRDEINSQSVTSFYQRPILASIMQTIHIKVYRTAQEVPMFITRTHILVRTINKSQ
jgi:hypothetical protein